MLIASLVHGHALENAKYPDWKGAWTRVVVPGLKDQLSFDQTKASGLGQQAPLTPEYQKLLEDSIADQRLGGSGNFFDRAAHCMPSSMPMMMSGVSPLEFVVTPETSYILIGEPSSAHYRRIFTDGRGWPRRIPSSHAGYSIGHWIDKDGDGVFDVLEVETRGPFKGPRAYDRTGLPLHSDNLSIFKERLYLDKADPNILHDEITVIDHALSRPWTVDKKYTRSPNRRPKWIEAHCSQAEANVRAHRTWVLIARSYKARNYDPHVLKPEAELALKPGESFRECLKDCPEMIVIPAGSFVMGSPSDEKGRYDNEGDGDDRQHKVTIAKPFAVSKLEVTFAQWDACVSAGGCPHDGIASDQGWGRGARPVINVSWNDAKQYAAWISRMTGKKYRLLSEAEWEYAARAGTQTAFFWGQDPGQGNANCNKCGAKWNDDRTAPAGSFPPNRFGLYDMSGNVWEWVEDCYHQSYSGAPDDGSVWAGGDCSLHLVRGGSWFDIPEDARSAMRFPDSTGARSFNLGFRVARTLGP
jgi:formylglycine-generating enzyme required for sulfatase activity